MVKIAISTVSPGGLTSIIDHRFGRCDCFTIVETDDSGEVRNIEVLKNPAVQEAGGAGIQAAQTIANKDCEVLITGRVGPNAYEALKKLGIKIYMAPIGSNVKSLIDSYFKNELPEYETYNAPPHSGINQH
ncbi:MAG: NifB/NifX family molybdenum-iron cluster-binding protein [Candidatus Odinarchaeia archaeon]